MHNNKLILLDGDGVLLDYHEGYARAWEQAFGVRPQVRDPLGYHPRHYWDVPDLAETERAHLHEKGFTAEIWATMPAMPGAVEACELLQSTGFALIFLHTQNQRAAAMCLLPIALPQTL